MENSKKSINVEGGFFFFKISKRDFTFIREMRVSNSTAYDHIYFLDQCGWGKFKPSGWLGKKIPNLARG